MYKKKQIFESSLFILISKNLCKENSSNLIHRIILKIVSFIQPWFTGCILLPFILPYHEISDPFVAIKSISCQKRYYSVLTLASAVDLDGTLNVNKLTYDGKQIFWKILKIITASSIISSIFYLLSIYLLSYLLSIYFYIYISILYI
jgi:hypothetical protein